MKKYLSFKVLCLSIICAITSVCAEANEGYEVVVQGLGDVVFETSGAGDIHFSIFLPDRGQNKGGIQTDEHKYVSYEDHLALERQGKPKPEHTTYKDCVVCLSSREVMKDWFYYFLLPWFDVYGIYSHKLVEQNMPYWNSIYKLSGDRIYSFKFIPEKQENLVYIYLDGSLLTKIPSASAVTGARSPEKNGLKILSKKTFEVRTAGYEELMAIPNRAHPLLQKGARMSIPSGLQVIKGIPMTVWPPEMSIDQGKHFHTGEHRSLTDDPMHKRTPWKCGPEYFQWRVRMKAWEKAWVLCADIPAEGKEPTIGINFAKFGTGCTWGNINTERKPISEGVKVGTLQYRSAGGAQVSTPIYLVEMPLKIDVLGARGKSGTSLDFEFCGTGTPSWMANGKRSSVQILGCSLEESPYSYKVANPIRGNIFEQPNDLQKGLLKLTANRDNVKGTVNINIFGPDHRTLKKATKEFTIEKAGETIDFPINLTRFGVGWYGMDIQFLDDAGKEIAKHEAAFTVLAPDDREAGYESPYAAWPHSGGYHGSNPDPMGPREVMRKAGYRNSWEPPCESEEEGKPWKIGLNTLGYRYCQPGEPSKTRAEFDARLDKQVEGIKKQIAAFPHAQVIQLLHEQGGREIAEELLGKREPKRGVYKGWDFNVKHPKWWEDGSWEVFYCTEWAKRLRKEFPDKKIMIGNGSSSSEKIASLIRHGFDLNLIDQLGIESKGFQTMPELASHREAPGMLWALRETGRVFGYTNYNLNACNEYVFRPERPSDVSEKVSNFKRMLVTDYTLRDYLISLAHGCTIISTGHLEDAADAYYDTNWGAGGQCTAYPYSYPKRMFTTLAVLTRVLDCPKYLRRFPTGEVSTYMLEFLRNRKIKDYAYAMWTPQFPCVLEVTFPQSALVTHFEAFGKATPLTKPAKSSSEGNSYLVPVGSTPCYLVSSEAAISSKVVAHPGPKPPQTAKPYFTPNDENTAFSQRPLLMDEPGPGTPGTKLAKFTKQEIDAPEFDGKGLSFTLIREGECKEVLNEGTEVHLRKTPEFKIDDYDGVGMWVKGNGSFGKFRLLISNVAKHDGYPGTVSFSKSDLISFDGWRYLEAKFPERYNMGRDKTAGNTFRIVSAVVGTARVNLDPIEMSPVENDFAIGPIYLLPKGTLKEDEDSTSGVEKIMKTQVLDRDL